MFWLYNQSDEEKEEKQEISTRDISNAIALLPLDHQTTLNLLGNRLPLGNSSQELDQQSVQYQTAAAKWLEAYEYLKKQDTRASNIILEKRVLYYQRVAAGLLKNYIGNKHGLRQTFDLITYEKYLQAEAKLSNFHSMLGQEKILYVTESIFKITKIAKEYFDAKEIGLTLYRAAKVDAESSYPQALLQTFYVLAAENLRNALDQARITNKELFNTYREAVEKSWELMVKLKDGSSHYEQIEKMAGDEMEFLSIRLEQRIQQGQSMRGIKSIDHIEMVTPQSTTLRRVNRSRNNP